MTENVILEDSPPVSLDPQNKTTIFVSHRLEDGEIAEMIGDALKDLSQDVELFVAQNSQHRNAEFGKNLSDDVARILDETELVLLIYTNEDQDWSWCMWETGVATNPRNPEGTRIVPISMTGAVPRVFEGKLVVQANSQESIRSFFKQFCTDPNFFPGHNGPLTTRPDDWIEGKADALFEKICSQPAETRRYRRCDRFLLYVDAETVMRLKEDEQEQPDAAAVEEIIAAAKVINPSRQVGEHFGITEDFEKPTLAEIRARWEICRAQSDIPRSENRPWTAVLVEELWRICNRYSARLTWEPFLGVSNQNWLFPLVIEYAILPNGAYEFDIAVISTLKPGDVVPGQ